MDFFELIDFAKKDNCSDVHITCGTHLAVRRFGKLKILADFPSIEEAEWMILCTLNEQQKNYVLKGNDLDLAIVLKDGSRLRANIYHQRNNLAAAYRILHTQVPTMDELQIPQAVRNFCNCPRGLVLITGPTGCGKTTTLASMIDHINQTQAKHIITIEDPIEYVYYHANSMIHQREIGKDVRDFASGLRSSLREDPDIILVGEMRDYETINAAMTAAETGHLVLSTLHTASAAQTIDRIIDVYPPHAQGQARSLLAKVLRGVCTQVLVPLDFGEGMTIATEVLVNVDAVSNMIRENKIHQIPSTLQSGGSVGMHTMNADLKRLERSTKISRETALKYCTSVSEYNAVMV